MTCKNCERIAVEANQRNYDQLNRIWELEYDLDRSFKLTPLWAITGLFILVILITAIAVKSFEYGAEQVATGKLKCVTVNHNTMCEEVKK